MQIKEMEEKYAKSSKNIRTVQGAIKKWGEVINSFSNEGLTMEISDNYSLGLTLKTEEQSSRIILLGKEVKNHNFTYKLYYYGSFENADVKAVEKLVCIYKLILKSIIKKWEGEYFEIKISKNLSHYFSQKENEIEEMQCLCFSEQVEENNANYSNFTCYLIIKDEKKYKLSNPMLQMYCKLTSDMNDIKRVNIKKSKRTISEQILNFACTVEITFKHFQLAAFIMYENEKLICKFISYDYEDDEFEYRFENPLEKIP